MIPQCEQSFGTPHAFHDEPGSVGEVLARLSELAVPGTATEFEFDGVELPGGAE
jgi:hypothetical protein